MNVIPVKNEKGFTLIEMLVAMAISSILLGAAMYTYTKQDKVLRSENTQSKLRDYVRMAMDQLEGDLRMAGFGFPPGDINNAFEPARGVAVADATTLTYMANTDNVSTNASVDVASNTNGFFTTSTTGFAVGDNVVFFEPENPDKWVDNTYPVNGIGTTTIAGVVHGIIAWSPSNRNDNAFSPVEDNVAVVLNKYHTFTYAFDSTNKIITLTDDNGTSTNGDDTTVTVASKISALTFRYFDSNGNSLTTLPLSASDLGDVRGVEIEITVVDDDDPEATATLITGVQMRNMGI